MALSIVVDAREIDNGSETLGRPHVFDEVGPLPNSHKRTDSKLGALRRDGGGHSDWLAPT
jgi:hypothetical protein